MSPDEELRIEGFDDRPHHPKDWKKRRGPPSPAAPMGAVYGLGVVGAAVYYIQAASTFWGGVLGFLKALVWPAFFVYDVLRFVGA